MLGRRAEVTLDSPRALRTVLDAGIVAGAGGGIEKTLLAGARFHEGAGYRSVLAFVHPASDRGFEKLRSRGAHCASSSTTAQRRFRSARSRSPGLHGSAVSTASISGTRTTIRPT
jgi:hypothetical protein